MTTPPHVADMPLLAASAFLDAPAVVGGAQARTWRQIHAAALRLSQAFDSSQTICNLCQTRAGFLVTWLAALRRGCGQVLPPSGANVDLVQILRDAGGARIVVDSASAVHPSWPALAQVQVIDVAALLREAAAQGQGLGDGVLAWTPPLGSALLRLYTSGSTGQPQPQDKTLGQFVQGALRLRDRLAQLSPPAVPGTRRIVCSVPAQHMFGIEAAVMLSLVTGWALHEGRPLLPADVAQACADSCSPASAADVLWVATPLHLKGLVDAGERLPGCHEALVSTMPLAPALAARAEALLGVPVLEIYGSTETGALATRRGAQDARWQPMPDVTVRSEADATSCSGAHFPSPHRLADQIRVDADGRFELLGRVGDVVKIAGRRASMAGLNLMLQELPGLREGVFFQPATSGEGHLAAQRMVLIHAGPLDRAAALDWLRQRVDAAFLPRRFIEVEALPRSGAGKIALGALVQIWERSREVMGGVTTEMTVPEGARHAGLADGAMGKTRDAGADADLLCMPAGHPALPGHFPGAPVVPGVWLLAEIARRVGQATGRRVVAMPLARLSRPLLPERRARLQWEQVGEQVSFRLVAADAPTDRSAAGQDLAQPDALIASGRLRLADVAP